MAEVAPAQPYLSRPADTAIETGVDIGTKLAATKSTIEAQRVDTQVKRAALDGEMNRRELSEIANIIEYKDDPKKKKYFLDRYERIVSQMGRTVDKSAIDAFTEGATGEHIKTAINSILYSDPELLKDPQVSQTMGLLRQGDPQSLATIEKFAKNYVDLQNARIRYQARGSGLQAWKASRKEAIALLAKDSPEKYSDASISAAYNADEIGQATPEQLDILNSVNSKQGSFIATEQKRKDETLGVAKGNLTTRQRNSTTFELRQKLASISSVVKDPNLRKSLVFVGLGESAKALLDKAPGDVKWADLTEVNTEINRMLTASSVLPASRDEKIDFKSFKRDWDTQVVSKIRNHESGGPSKEQLKIVGDRIQKLISKQKDASMQQLNLLIAGAKQTIPGTADSIKDAIVQEYKLGPAKAAPAKPPAETKVSDQIKTAMSASAAIKEGKIPASGPARDIAKALGIIDDAGNLLLKNASDREARLNRFIGILRDKAKKNVSQ